MEVIYTKGAPGSKPTAWGQHAVDITNKKLYVSMGVDAVTDWDEVVTDDIVGYDSTGGWQYFKVDSTKTKVRTVYFTGTLDADTATAITHGLDYDKILTCTAMLLNDVNNEYVVGGFKQAASAAPAYSLLVEASVIDMSAIGANLQGNNYRVKVEYYV